jgi:hypothetical protein
MSLTLRYFRSKLAVVFPDPMYDGGLCSTSSAEALSFEGEVALHPGVPRQGTDHALYVIRLLRFAIRTSMFSAHANGQWFFLCHGC